METRTHIFQCISVWNEILARAKSLRKHTKPKYSYIIEVIFRYLLYVHSLKVICFMQPLAYRFQNILKMKSMGAAKDAINSLLTCGFSLLVEHGGCSRTSNAAVCTKIKCTSHTGRATAFNATLSLLGAGLCLKRKPVLISVHLYILLMISRRPM